MKRIITLSGVELPTYAGLPTVVRTEEGRAMGGVPGWKFMMDPAYMVDGAPRNRAKPNSVSVALDQDIPIGEGLNSQPVFAIDIGTDGATRLDPNVGFNNNAWSVFLVVDDKDTSALANLVRSNSAPASGELNIRISTTAASAFAVFEGDSTSRLVYYPGAEGGFRGVPTLWMVTFSTRDGLRIFRDGVLRASAPDDTRTFDSDFGAGQWEFFNSGSDFNADVGISGLLDIDLGWAEHAGYRRAIENFLMTKYGISAP